MAKDIVILNILENIGGISSVRFVIWIPITAAYPQPGFQSAYQEISTDTNTTGILAALQAGTLIEELLQVQVPTSMIVNSWSTAVEPIMLAMLNARKAYRAGTAPALPDPGLKYKIVHDTVTGWSA